MLYAESEYKKVFYEADKDRDGFIDYADLFKMVKDVDDMLPDHIIRHAFMEAKTRIPPAEKMDLPEFMDAMGKLMAWKKTMTSFIKGPIIYGEMSSQLARWLTIPRFSRWLYEEFFHETDSNRDGLITTDEFLLTLQKFKMEYLFKTIQLEFKKHTSRADGFMTLNEFMIAMGFPPLSDEPPKPKPVKKPKAPKFELGASLLKTIFDSVDKDKSGTLDRAELKAVFMQMGQEMEMAEIDAMITANDRTGSGVLNFEQFINSVYPSIRETGTE